MKAGLIIIIALFSLIAWGQNPPSTNATAPTLEFQSVDEWLQDNVDPDVLNALKGLDDGKVNKLLSELQLAMAGTNINQLATLRDTAKEIIPILQKYEETSDYGDWLQMRLDDLEAAQELKSGKQVTVTDTRNVWTRRMSKRPWPANAKNYVPQLKKIFAEEGLPPELVWVAEVESSFNAKARSPAGAAGMFQLMPQTARDQQLSLWPWDERLQPEKSARAAAKYLRALHTHYHDWRLAFAAYNSGPGRVDKLLKGQRSRTFESIARRLPAETQLYVPKVEATVWRREGIELESF